MSSIHKSDTLRSRAKWDARFMRLAQEVGSWSKDTSRKVGCVIVGPNNEVRATGYNGFPRQIDDSRTERYERPAKYLWTEHAERNAIYNAAFAGVRLEGCSLYIPWYPCVDCARAIVQAGISSIVAFEPDWHEVKWGEGFKVAKQMFEEARCTVRFLDQATLVAATGSKS